MYQGKKRLCGLVCILGALLFLSSTIFSAPSCTAAVVWEDNFNDLNYDGWSVDLGNFTAEDAMLVCNATPGEWSQINHTSQVASGTWSFDIYANTTTVSYGEHFYIFFLTESAVIDGPAYDYDLMVWVDPGTGTPGITLFKREGAEEADITTLGEWTTTAVSGWYHIDITRNMAGQFYVFINGSLIIAAVDTTHQTSNWFMFVSTQGNAIDNIVVKDSIDFEPADLHIVEASSTVTCDPGGNDTTTFNVENTGELPGSATLVVGTTPSGITVTLDTSSITNLPGGNSELVTATIEVAATVAADDYMVDIELRDGTTVNDTITLTITVLAPTTTPTTTGIPGFPWEGLVIGLVTALFAMFWIRRRRR